MGPGADSTGDPVGHVDLARSHHDDPRPILAGLQRHRVAQVMIVMGGLYATAASMSFFLPERGLFVSRLVSLGASGLVLTAGLALLVHRPSARRAFPLTFAAAVVLLTAVLLRVAVRPDAIGAVLLGVHIVAVAAVLPSRRWFLGFSAIALVGAVIALSPGGASIGFDGRGLLIVGATLLAQVVNAVSIAVHLRMHDMTVSLARQNAKLEAANGELAVMAISHRILNEATAEGVCIHANGRVLHVNRAFANLLGEPTDALPGRRLAELIPQLDGAAAGSPSHIVLARKDMERVVAVERRTLAMDDGERRVLTLRDVTEAYHARADLERALFRLSEAERIAHIGAWEWNVATGEVYWSPELFRIFGRDPAAGPPTFDGYFSYIPPDERVAVREMAEGALRDRQPFTSRHHVLRPDGSRRRIDVRATIATDDDGDVVVRGTSRDATDADQAEERFRALLESAPDPMVIVDGDGVVVLVNHQTEVVFGYDRAELLGEKVEKLVPPEVAGRHIRYRADYAAAPFVRPMGTGRTLHAVRKDGRRIPVEISLSPLEREGQVFVTAAIRDVTDRQRAAEADRVALERLLRIQQLTEIDRVKTSLFNTASHELNTPLTPLKMQIYLLRGGHFGPVTPQQARSLEILDRNVQRLSKLNRDILDVARLQSGHLNLSLHDEDLAGLVEETATAFAPAAADKGITLKTAVSARPSVRVDRGRIEQILYNLVNNSLKFTSSGGRVTMHVTVDHGAATVAVRDTGIGLVADQIARLFEPFSQVHDPDADRQNSGTGLGLYLSRELARRHGGTLEAESPGAGKGATFRFSLPLVETPEATAADPQMAVQGGEGL